MRTPPRRARLAGRRTFHVALLALPLAGWACTSHPLTSPSPQPEMVTDVYISIAPNRQLDLVFMIDNSPSMAPKQEKLRVQFPKLIAALKDPNDGSLPDLRIAIIDSDLGTGNTYPSGSCGPKTLSDGTISPYGDLGRFQMIGATDCGVSSPDALWLEHARGQPVNYAGNIEDVFACLASNLGTLGCGQEHQLQAFEFALVANGLGNEQQHKMLRPSANLGLVFLSDEDDCSAAMNDGMFGNKPELRGESASLRCATRAHACAGGNLSDSPPGYPTQAAFAAPLSTCAARTDDCPNPTDGTGGTDTAGPTACSPLKGVKRLADEIKALKIDPDNQILVAGIFGWPTSNEDWAKAQYKIDLVPNLNAADSSQPQVYDSWPICYDPRHRPSDPNIYDPVAVGWGATGGLRLSAFVDEFGANGLKFSICETDFSRSMRLLGEGIADAFSLSPCVDHKLVDVDLAAPGIQADCRVVFRVPRPDPVDPRKVSYVENPESMPRCDPGKSDNAQPAYPCWKLVNDTTRCWVNGQLIAVVRSPSERSTPLEPGTKVGMQCRTCIEPNPTVPVTPGCAY